MSDASVFTVGGTVQAGGGLYLTRQADEDLLALCRSSTFAYVLTPRQMGKSSLMVRTAERLEAEGIQAVIIDLTQIGVEVTAETWHLGLLAAIEDRFDLDTDVFSWWEKHAHLGVTQRLTLYFENVVLAEVDGPIVVFVDEIDTTLSLPFTDDFYAAIRYMHNARAVTPAFQRLSFVLIGVATPGDLIADPKRTPFNIGRRVDLTDFTAQEAEPLAAGFGLPADQGTELLGWILAWTGGHPYLTQRLCRVIARENRTGWAPGEVERAVGATFFGDKSEEDNNLQFVRDMLTRRAPDKLAVLGTYREVRRGKHPVQDEEQSIVKNHLKLSGVVRRSGGALAVRNPIYETVFDPRWIKQNWPEHWLKRIPPAVWGVIGLLLLTVMLLILNARTLRMVAEEQRRRAEAEKRMTAEAEARARAEEAARHEAEGRARVEAESRAQAEENARLQEALAREARVHAGNAEKARWEAEVARAEEERARYQAEALFRQNTSRRLAISANDRLAEKPDLALLLSVEAFRIDENDDTRGNLAKVVSELPRDILAILGRTDALVLQPAFSPDGLLLASAGPGDTVALWEPLTRTSLDSAPGPDLDLKDPICLAFDAAGRTLAVGFEEGRLGFWRLETGRVRAGPDLVLLTTGEVTSLAFSPDGRTLLAGGREELNAHVWVIDVESREVIDDLSLPTRGEYVTGVKFRTERSVAIAVGELFNASSPELGLFLWDLATRESQEVSLPTTARSSLNAFDISAHGPLLAVGVSMLSDPGEDRFSTRMEGRTTLFDLETRRVVSELPTRGPVYAVAFHPTKKLVVTGGAASERQRDRLREDRGALMLWDITEPERPRLKYERKTPSLVSGLAISPGGRFMASTHFGGELILWREETEMNAGDDSDVACRVANRNLTREEWDQLIGPETPYRETCPDLPTSEAARAQFDELGYLTDLKEEIIQRMELGEDVSKLAVEFATKVTEFLAVEKEHSPEQSTRLALAAIEMIGDEGPMIARQLVERDGDYRRAVSLCEAVLELDPTNFAFRSELAEILESQFGQGSISGRVSYSNGDPDSAILFDADPQCVMLNEDPVLTERIVTNGSGGLGNAFVYVKQGLSKNFIFPAPAEARLLDQDDCRFRPHVLGVQVGQTLVIRNSDPTLHNVHAFSRVNQEFNMGQPFEGMELERRFSEPEVMVPIRCDVHPWMNAYVGVLDHPFFAVSDENGAFRIEKLPAGTYTLEAWHEELGTSTRQVEVSDGEAVDVEFPFDGDS